MNKKLIKVSNALSLTEFKHIFKVMKLTSLFGVLCVSSAFAVNVNSQSLRVNIHANQKQAKEVIKQIEEQTDYLFVYNHDKVNLNNTVTIQANNETVAEVLNQMFAGTDIIYAMQGNNILLMQKDAVVQQSGKVVTGTIVDPSGMPVIGANVMVKGTTNGTITDMDGKFSLEVEEGATLQISYIGYANQEIKVGNQKTLSIALKEDAEALDEVVVVGYGSVKKQNLTSSISKITDEAVKERPITTISEALQGQLAGVRSSAFGGGVPGEEMTIRIRGTNTINGDSSPLYVIDGVPRENMSDLNPSDIASIQVLKDASATSIYGSRGANGVILIETKQGEGKPTITFDAYYGMSTPEKKLDIMSGEEWVAWNMYRRNLNHLRAGGSMSDPMSMRQASNQIPESWYTTNTFTDWQDAVMHTAPIQNYQASASAKGSIGAIYFSAGYTNQEGIVKYSYYERLNARLNASINISEKLRAGVNFSVSGSSKDGADSNKGDNGNGKESSLHHALMVTPLMRLDEGTRD